MKKIKLIKMAFLVFALGSILVACEKEIPDKETTKNLSNNSNGLVSKEKVDKPTINFDEILDSEEKETEETKKILNELEYAMLEESLNKESNIENEVEDGVETEAALETETEMKAVNVFDMVVETDDRVMHDKVDVDTTYWTYGLTPCEWVYIEPGVQIISNYKPNSSAKYSIRSMVSSGLKGCYIPVFCKTDMMGSNYDGRFYCFEDYKKITPNNMLFNNSLRTIKYKNISIEEILRQGLVGIERTQNGLLKVGDLYINIVYVTDLDKILNGSE